MNTEINVSESSFQPLDLQEDVAFGQINKMMMAGDIEGALGVVNTNFLNFAHRPEFLLLASQVYKEAEHIDQEVKVLQKLVAIQKKSRYQTLLSEALAKQGDFPSALKVLHEVLDESDGKDPILFEVYKNMGNIYLKCGDIEAAEEKYNLANAIDSDDENLSVNYGVLAIQKEDYEEAKSRFSQVLEKNNSSDLAWVGMALVHRAHSDNDLARACLLRGLDENSYNKLALCNYYQWCTEDGVGSDSSLITNYLEKYPQDQEIKSLQNGVAA